MPPSIKAYCVGSTHDHYSGYCYITVCVEFENAEDGTVITFAAGSLGTKTAPLENGKACVNFPIPAHASYSGTIYLGDVVQPWSINVGDSNQPCNLE